MTSGMVPATTIITSLVVSSIGAWVLFHGIAEMKLLGGKTREEMPSWSGAHRQSVERKFLGAVRPCGIALCMISGDTGEHWEYRLSVSQCLPKLHKLQATWQWLCCLSLTQPVTYPACMELQCHCAEGQAPCALLL